jgi:hypothetical protein
MQIRKRVLLGVVAALVLPLLAIGCSNNGDSSQNGVSNSPEPVLTRIVEGETSPVIESAGPTLVLEPGPSETPEIIAPAPTGDVPPDTTATSGGTTVGMGIGTYCWTTKCVDKIGVITRGTLTIASGDEVAVAVPSGAPALNSVSVFAFPAADPQPLDNGETAWRPDFDGVMLTSELDEDVIRVGGTLEAGTYVLSVGMFFASGDVQYGVVLEVQ